MTSNSAPSPSATGIALAGTVVTLCLMAVAWFFFANPSVLPPKDFVEYWAAARVALEGGNPYHGDALLPWQRVAAHEPDRHEAVMMWNPPWTLPVYFPLAWLEPRTAQFAWLTLQTGLIVVSAILLWKLYGGPREHVGAALLIALTFYATLWTIKYGQNTGLLLFGLAGFAYFDAKNRPVLAGACAALTALKPHLLAVFGVLLVLNVLRPRGVLTLVSGVAVIAMGLVIALAVNADVLDQYLAALRRPKTESSVPLHLWQLPQGAYYLRMALVPHDPQGRSFWIQFVPCILACGVYATVFLRRRKSWNWSAELPAIIWVSVLTAPYGGWIFDLLVLLVPVIQAAVWLAHMGRPGSIRLFAACHLVLTAATFTFVRFLDDFWWVAPCSLLLYLAAWSTARRGRIERDS